MAISSTPKLLKLECEACHAIFHSTLSAERVLGAPCPNCEEVKLKLIWEKDNEAPTEHNIPIRD